MKLFIDSSQKKFVAAVFDDNFKVVKAIIYETKFKVESIIEFFNEIEGIEYIDSIYVNKGPGSFTGARSALLYVRTIAQLKDKIKIFATTTFDLLQKQEKRIIFTKRIFYVDATKTKSYCMAKHEVKLVEKKPNKEKEIDYEQMIKNFPNYISQFSLVATSDLHPFYASSPQIGKNKWKKDF